MNISIYVCTHKKVDIPILPDPSSYLLLQCGDNSTPNLGYLRANTKDNIGDLDWYYCELIGAYWIWKNTTSDIVGLLHYHRFLSYNDHLPTPEDIKCLMNEHDVILPPPHKSNISFYQCWISRRKPEALKMLGDIIHDKSPDVSTYYNSFLYDKTGYSLHNICICRKNDFDEYCSWLFPILEELRLSLDMSQYRNGVRFCGLLGEFLINVWFLSKQSRILYLPLLTYPHDYFVSK